MGVFPTRCRKLTGLVANGGTPLAGAERAMLAVLAAGTLVIPTLYTSGLDVFRLPKELAFRGEAIVLLALAAFWATSRRRAWTLSWRPELVVAAAVVGWTLVTAAFSTNRPLSTDSLITVVAAAVIFIATCLAAQTTSIVAVDVLMAGACANAVLVILQELNIWTPFVQPPEVAGHYGSVAFLGNANYVGTFLSAPALAAVVLAVTSSGGRRWTYTVLSALLVAGITASATRTAVIALVAGLFVFALARSRRAALATAAIVIVLALLALRSSTSIGERMRDFADAAKKRDYERLFSERLLPTLAAADMARDHPLLGVGPGTFRYHFMAYRVALDKRYPKEWTRGWPGNWGAAHNDHVQVAAEAGLPGYVLFLAAIGVGAGAIGKRRERAAASRLEARFARSLRWPLATLAFVLCLAQFPLELAAPRLMLLTLGALAITWDERDAA